MRHGRLLEADAGLSSRKGEQSSGDLQGRPNAARLHLVRCAEGVVVAATRGDEVVLLAEAEELLNLYWRVVLVVDLHAHEARPFQDRQVPFGVLHVPSRMRKD